MNQFQHLAPDLILSLAGTAVLLTGAIRSNYAQLADFLRWLTLIALVSAGLALFSLLGISQPVAAHGWVLNGSLNIVFSVTFLAIVAWTVLACATPEKAAGEWYGLLLFVALGMVSLARSGNLAMLFLGIEVLSLALYVLISFRYKHMLSIRAGTMYLVLAGFASGFLVFGLALIYAVYGTLDLSGIQQLAANSRPPIMAWIGIALFLVGIGFKLSLVPFHMWAPEVYEAAPGAISGLIASASKGAVLSAFIPFLFILRTHSQVIWGLAAASMIGGNLLALRENRLKRILAYSSIGHVGYMMIGFLAGWGVPGNAPPWLGSMLDWDDQGGINSGVRAMAFYVIAYAIAILGAFTIVSCMEHEETATLRDLRGIARKRPVHASCLMAFIVSLAGLPPTVGFFGKLYLFAAGVSAGYIWLAVVGLAGSSIGVYYYLRFLVNLFMLPPDSSDTKLRVTDLQTAVIVCTAVASVVLGLFPDLLTDFIHPR